MLRDRSSPCAVFELAAGALEVSSGRLDTTKSTGHTSDRGKQIPVESYYCLQSISPRTPSQTSSGPCNITVPCERPPRMI